MINSRLTRLPPYPFQRLASLLDGIDPGAPPLALSLGEPQQPPPPLVAEILAAVPDLWRPYPPAAGTPDWKTAASGWLTRRYTLPAGMIPPEAVIPASGTREALFMLGALVVEGDPRHEGRRLVVMPDPLYLPYLGGAMIGGAEILPLPARPETGFLPDVLGLPAAVLDRAAAVIVCSPSNPEGAVVSLEHWRALVTAARRHGFVLVADECYSELYDDTPPPGVLEACRDLGGELEGVLVFNSLSKRSGVAGMRSGLVAGDPALIAAFLRVRAYGGAGLPLPVQAASAALWADEAHVIAGRALHRARLDCAMTRLADCGLPLCRPAGGFFLWLDTRPWGETGEETAQRLWREAGLKVLPGAFICADPTAADCPGRHRLRVALVHDIDTLDAALTRFAAARPPHHPPG